MISKITVIMPLGGLGTRALPYTKGRFSKFLIPLSSNSTVLDIILKALLRTGFKNFLFCIGHLFTNDLVERIMSYQSVFRKRKIEYFFSFEKKRLGGGQAYFQAFSRYEASDPVISIPGDMFLPWNRLINSVKFHIQQKSDVTFGLTSYITKMTSDVGRIWVNKKSNVIVKCFDRNETLSSPPSDVFSLTSAGVFIINRETYLKMFEEFKRTNKVPEESSIEMRDNLLPWLSEKTNYIVKSYDLKGEVLDIGVPERIKYAKKNWRKYA